MPRGQKALTTSQMNTENAIGAQANTESQGLFGTLAPAYTNLAQNGGYDAATQQKIINQGTEAVNSNFGTAADRIASNAARTNNPAGAVAGYDELALQKGAAQADSAQKAAIDIANNKQSQQQLGRQGLAQLFGVSEDQIAKMYGLGNNALGLRGQTGSTGPIRGGSLSFGVGPTGPSVGGTIG